MLSFIEVVYIHMFHKLPEETNEKVIKGLI